MKYIYITTAIITFILLCVATSLSFVNYITIEQLLLFMAFMNGIAIIVFCYDRITGGCSRNNIVEKQEKELIEGEECPINGVEGNSEKIDLDSIEPESHIEDDELCLERIKSSSNNERDDSGLDDAQPNTEIKDFDLEDSIIITEPEENGSTKLSCDEAPNLWSRAMYKKYAQRWTDIFEKIKYPIEDNSKADISVICWEIASVTMDYLLTDNEDPNVLERNKSNVKALLEEKKIDELDLKEFFEDPTTVPVKVIGVYNTLSSQFVENHSAKVEIFGYLVELYAANKNEIMESTDE